MFFVKCSELLKNLHSKNHRYDYYSPLFLFIFVFGPVVLVLKNLDFKTERKQKTQQWRFSLFSVGRSCVLAPHMGRLYVCQWFPGQDSQILGPARLHCHHCGAQPIWSVAVLALGSPSLSFMLTSLPFLLAGFHPFPVCWLPSLVIVLTSLPCL